MRAHRLSCAAVVLSALVGGAAVANADVVTPVAESGTFDGAASGLAGCWGERGGSLSYCVVAYDTGVATATPVRLRAWAWDGSATTPQPVASIDTRLPEAALAFGTDLSGVADAVLDATVADTHFGHLHVTLTQSQPLTTEQSTDNDVTGAAADVLGDDVLGAVAPELYTATSTAAIAPSPCPSDYPVSSCTAWDTGSIGPSGYVFGSGWFWSQADASGGWNVTPGTAPTLG